MNFLAHLYLSSDFNEEMIGNFIADSVKGKEILRYSEEIVKGIRLHRDIDCFTDHHPIFCRSKERLRPKYRKYSGVVTDIFYDHFLARLWNEYSNVPLSEYVDKVYRHMYDHFHLLPPKVQFFLPRMVGDNWLLSYSEFAGIAKVLNGMSSRSSFGSNMKNAVEDLEKDYLYYQEDFTCFFSELCKYVQGKRKGI